jgi:hypothetical protein
MLPSRTPCSCGYQGTGAGTGYVIVRIGVLRMTNCLMIASTDTALKRAELMAQGGILDQPHATGSRRR